MPASRSRSPAPRESRESREPRERSRSRDRNRDDRRGDDRRGDDRRGGGGGDGARQTGIAQRWNEKGFGFIKPDDGGEDVFCHFSGIKDGKCLRMGDKVEFRKASFSLPGGAGRIPFVSDER